jgi:undecaprenyl-phosphate 4-deoxy-4-formamido-L-arabinose transferase
MLLSGRRSRARALGDPRVPVVTHGISVIIPVFRSARILPELHDRLTTALIALEMPYEIVLVEDAGNDGSWTVVQDLASADDHVRGFTMSRNYGQHNAVLCGIREARFDHCVTMDDDLQNPPEEIATLLGALGDFDVVYGTPDKEQHGFLRDQASRVTKIALQSVMGAETARHVSAFRLLRTSLRDAFVDYRGTFVTIDVLLTWGTTRFTHVTVRHDQRAEGKSNYTPRKLLSHAVNMMTGFTTLPLQVASVVGFTFTAFGVLVLVYVLGSFVVNGGSSVPGFAFLASIVAIFSGAQLFALGIIGEYLARIHYRSMDRPSYIVRTSTDDVEGEAEQTGDTAHSRTA